MALMHAMQSGHPSTEGALLRILSIPGETRPKGDRWDEDLMPRGPAAHGRIGQAGYPHTRTRTGGRGNATVPQQGDPGLQQLRSGQSGTCC